MHQPPTQTPKEVERAFDDFGFINVCPRCGAKVKFSHEDDVGTKFFKCEKCEDQKKRKIIYINLHQKILIFMDQPHDQLLQRLRPLLSHDRKTITHKITDRRKTAGLKTKTVFIEGLRIGGRNVFTHTPRGIYYRIL